MSNNTIKLPDAELNEIKQIQSKANELVFKLGEIQLEKFGLEEQVKEIIDREKKIKEYEEEQKAEWLKMQKSEKDLLENIIKKYGEGNLDLNTGTFTPVAKVS